MSRTILLLIGFAFIAQLQVTESKAVVSNVDESEDEIILKTKIAKLQEDLDKIQQKRDRAHEIKAAAHGLHENVAEDVLETKVKKLKERIGALAEQGKENLEAFEIMSEKVKAMDEKVKKMIERLKKSNEGVGETQQTTEPEKKLVLATKY